MPDDDADFSLRLRLIKTYVTKKYRHELGVHQGISQSLQKRREGNLWQRRYWEHPIRNEEDFATHCDYIHYNPVRHRLCERPQEWEYSSIHRFIAEGIYPSNWGQKESCQIPYAALDIL